MELDYWRLLAGLGFFLFSMSLIEGALEQVSGRSLRQFLRRNSDRPIKGVLSGTVATAILQSSSVVGLLMLALVGAGVVQMRNALSMIFGANLGTTITGWIVATIGFTLDLDALALPFIAVGGLVSALSSSRQLAQYARIVLGLGLLLMGLQFMKASVSDLINSVDVSMLAGYNALQFLLFGLVFCAIIRSSSATMMVTLSALNAGIIDLPAAAAIAIGADLGTTSTVLIGAIKGSAAKKRVALGHLLFNVGTDTLAFVLLMPLLAVVSWFGLNDLLSLVAFHSLFNLLGILLFLPLIGPFANLLERLVRTTDETIGRHLAPATAAMPETALEAIELETDHLLQRVICQNLKVTDPPIRILVGNLPVGPTPSDGRLLPLSASFKENYDATKRLEGEIVAFTADAQATAREAEDSRRISRYQTIVREAVHAAKSLKDVHADLVHFEASGQQILMDYGERFRDALKEFYVELFRARADESQQLDLETIIGLNELAKRRHDELHQDIYADVRADRLQEQNVSSLLNVNREIYNSHANLLLALATRTLADEELEVLELLPVTSGQAVRPR